METDFVFRMGASHSVCQDYALAGVKDGVGYAIVSDGCSGIRIPGEPGSPYTDFGARLTALAASRNLQGNWSNLDAVLYDVAVYSALMRLPSTAMDATLVAAVLDGQSLNVHQFGDGVTVIRYIDGGVLVRSLEFGGNMPEYPSYLTDDKRKAQYLSEAKTVTVHTITRSASGAWSDARNPVDIALQEHRHLELSVDFVDMVLVMSDGAESFIDRNGAPVPLIDVVDQLLQIKNFRGEFLGRRAKRFLGKFCQENGWRHEDDFSVAGIYLGEQT